MFAEQRSLEHEPVALNGGGRSIIVELARDGLVRLLEPTIAEPVQAG